MQMSAPLLLICDESETHSFRCTLLKQIVYCVVILWNAEELWHVVIFLSYLCKTPRKISMDSFLIINILHLNILVVNVFLYVVNFFNDVYELLDI
jgi:hypothetical protein